MALCLIRENIHQEKWQWKKRPKVTVVHSLAGSIVSMYQCICVCVKKGQETIPSVWHLKTVDRPDIKSIDAEQQSHTGQLE